MNHQLKTSIKYNPLFYVFLFFTLVAFDQSTKLFIFLNEKILIKSFNITIIPILNYGVALGLFNKINKHQYILLFIFIVFLIGVLIHQAIQEYKNRKNITPYIFAIAGAVSNILDRVFYGGVLDFFTINFIDLYHLPFGNFADVFILSGLLIILYHLVKDLFTNQSNLLEKQ